MSLYLSGTTLDIPRIWTPSCTTPPQLTHTRKARDSVLLCISASFSGAARTQSCAIYFFQPFSTFFVHFKPFSVISCLKTTFIFTCFFGAHHPKLVKIHNTFSHYFQINNLLNHVNQLPRMITTSVVYFDQQMGASQVVVGQNPIFQRLVS